MSENPSKEAIERRDFLRAGAAVGALAALGTLDQTARAAQAKTAPRSSEFKVDPIKTVRVGFVGVGGMGLNHVRNLLEIDHVEIKAVCDIDEGNVQRAQERVVQKGRPKPVAYSRGAEDFRRMCDVEELDLVYTATPWRWHVPVCVAAMETGKHAATEVPAATTLEECWQLVETAERTKLHCVMMENCCYDSVELTILNMVRKGLLGELVHAECGYLHDLRALKFGDKGEGLWRIAHSIARNADLYPTHGLGPIAQCMNINRGNKFEYLVSVGSQSRGLQNFAAKKYGPEDKQAKQKYALSDVVTSILQTNQGQTIVVQHDTDTPRPYSRDVLVQGTKGLVRKYPDPKIYIEHRSPSHQWESLSSYSPEFDHPLWSSLQEKSKGKGHGGMDFVEDYRLIQCLREGKPLDFDVYDAVAWSAVTPLSEQSIAKRGASVDFPDFTRGKWKTNPPLGIVTG